MLWRRKPDPQKQLEAALLRQWRRRRLEDSLSSLPLELMLRHQSRRLAAIEEDVLAKTGLLPARRRLKRLIAKKLRQTSELLVKRPLNWLCRRRCLQPLRRAVVQSRRRLLVKLLEVLVRSLRSKLRQSPGSPRR